MGAALMGEADSCATPEGAALQRIAELLSAEDWETMPEALRALRPLAEQAPPARRAAFLRAALELTRRVRTEAAAHRRAEAARLANLRTGRIATESYRATATPSTVR